MPHEQRAPYAKQSDIWKTHTSFQQPITHKYPPAQAVVGLQVGHANL